MGVFLPDVVMLEGGGVEVPLVCPSSPSRLQIWQKTFLCYLSIQHLCSPSIMTTMAACTRREEGHNTKATTSGNVDALHKSTALQKWVVISGEFQSKSTLDRELKGRQRMQAEEKTDKWTEFTCIGLREERHLAGRGGGQALLGSPAAMISWYQRSESSLGIEGLLHAGWVWSAVQIKEGWGGKKRKNWYRKEGKKRHALKVWSGI